MFKLFYRPERPSLIRIWPILALAFGCLIALIAVSGWLAFVRAGNTYSGISSLQQSEHEAQEALSSVRSDIAESAILLRDFLLDPSLSAHEARSEMEGQHRAALAELHRLRELLPAQQITRLSKLREQAENYWRSLEPLLEDQHKRATYSLVEAEIVPRRQAAYRLVTEISELSFEDLLQRRMQIEARTGELARFLGRMLGLTLAIAIAVAGVSVRRIYFLERTASFQHAQMQDAEVELRNLSRQLVGSQEQERRALSRELHDQVGQVLTALRISIGNALLYGEGGDGRTLQELELAKRLVAQALRSTRDIAMGLRPSMLDDLGLEAALEWHARQHAKICGVPVKLNVQAPLAQLSDVQRTCVYRIVQEALTNSAKYANAKQVEIQITLAAGDVAVEIIDDGVGFDLESYKPGLGLLGIRERVSQLGGRLTVESNPERGTRIRTQFPAIAVNT